MVQVAGRSDNRRYVRMNTVFPVEFSVSGGAGRVLQGFTRNVSEGGLCLEFKALGEGAEERLHGPEVSLDLTINPTFSREAILARARVVWLKKEAARYLIGVAYEAIDPSARKRLISYALRMRWMPRVSAAAALVLLASLAGLALHNRTLRNENVRLAQELREAAARKSEVSGKLLSLEERRRELEDELTKMRVESELKLSDERETAIQAQLAQIGQRQEKLRESYRALEESGKKNSEAAMRGMSRWLSSHQNLRTGLVASFEGDPSLEDIAFTYDQSLAVQAFLLFDDLKHAEEILSFYDSRAAVRDGGYFNAYDTLGGGARETVVHTGPNLWVGIAALQYARRAGDERFVPMARRIGDWAVSLQDAEGGLPGGPGIAWYGTEHNLDAYAFFNMLAAVTGDSKYVRAGESALGWLKKYAYSNKGPSVNRGKGDSTIATDTFSWSVAAVGPEALARMGFDPEGILDFAEKNCEVKAEFRHPDGQTVDVRGFDFAKERHVGRGGVISTEWTAQMAVSYQVLARYFGTSGDPAKARRYLEKADFYRNELQKMILTSPSRTGQGHGCLPYASADNVDTGHGWRTPKGSSTGSVAATAYGLFAWKEYNPFELPQKEATDARL